MSQQTKAANVFIPIQPKPNQFDHIQDSEKLFSILFSISTKIH